MNWFKSSEDWEEKKLFHLINVIKFQIDNYEGMQFHPLSVSAPTPTRANFTVVTKYNSIYTVSMRVTNTVLDIIVHLQEPFSMVGSKQLDIDTSPYVVAEECLSLINDHINQTVSM